MARAGTGASGEGSGTECRWRSSATLASSPASVFQIGDSCLILSIASRAPANASARCAAETATITLGSPSGTVPTRCSPAAPSSPGR